MAWDITGNFGSALVTSGGTDAPASGTVETFVVSNPVAIPSISASVTQFRIVDANMASNPTFAEVMVVTNIVGASWTVMRGAEPIGSNAASPIAHQANWTAIVVTTNLGIANAVQNQTLNVNSASVGASVTVPIPNVMPYYNAGIYNLTQSGASLQVQAPYVGMNALIGVGQASVGGYSYLFTDAGGDVVYSGSPTALPNQVDRYRLLSLDGVNTAITFDGSYIIPLPVNSNPSITAAASPMFNIVSSGSPSSIVLTPTFVNANDLILVGIMDYNAINVSTVATSGTGTTSSWVPWVANYTDATSDYHSAIYAASVSGTGSASITITLSGAATNIEAVCQEFTASSSPTWSADGSGGHTYNSTSTVTMPSLTPSNTNEMYWGLARCSSAGGLTAGSTSGYTYDLDSVATWFGVIFNPNCAESAQAPTLTQSVTTCATVAVLVAA